jgi:hypothetical protein
MAQDVEINVVLQAIDNVTKEIVKINSSIDGLNKKNFDSVSAKTTAWATSISAVKDGLSLVNSVMAPFIEFGKEAIKQAIEQERSENLLKNALKERGIYSKQVYEETERIAEAMKKVSSFNDEQIKSAERILITQGVQLDRLKEVTEATINYAVSQRKDLSTAADTVGRSIGTMSNGLARAGVQLGNLYDIGERTNKVLDGLGRFSGIAAAESNSYEGATKRLGNAFDEFLGTLGKVITNSTVLKTALVSLAQGINWVNDGIKSLGLTGTETEKQIKTLNNSIKIHEIQLQKAKEANTGWLSSLTKSPMPIADLELAIKKEKEELSKLTEAQKKEDEEQKQSNNTKKTTNELTQALLDKYQGLTFAQAKYMDDAAKAKTIEDNRLKYSMAQFDVWKKTLTVVELLSNVLSEMKVNPQFAEKIGDLFKQGVGVVSGGAQSIKGSVTSNLISSGNPYAMAAGAIIEIFGKTKEEFNKWITDIDNMIIDLPSQIAENVPALVDKLVEDSPRFINALSDAVPILMNRVSEQLQRPSFWKGQIDAVTAYLSQPSTWVNLIITFQVEFIKMIPGIAQAFVNALLDKLNGAGSFFGNIGKQAGGFLGDVGSFLGFAEGGEVPAIVHEGENVIDRSTNEQLKDFLNNQKDRNLTVNITVGESDLANVILSLNQKGFRLA